MVLGLFMLIWMRDKKNVQMSIGMSIRTDFCQIPGEDSQNSLY